MVTEDTVNPLEVFPKVFKEILQLTPEEIKENVLCTLKKIQHSCIIEEVAFCVGHFPENITYEYNGEEKIHVLKIRSRIDNEEVEIELRYSTYSENIYYTLRNIIHEEKIEKTEELTPIYIIEKPQT